MRELINVLRQIESECFSSPWSEEQLTASLKGGTSLICILFPEEERLSVQMFHVQEGRLTQGSLKFVQERERNLRITGFAFFNQPVLSEPVELYRIGVIPDFQNQGCASLLLNHALAEVPMVFPGSDRILLEVQENNASALALYRKCGFQEIHVRRGYYGDCAALIMEHKLPPESIS